MDQQLIAQALLQLGYIWAGFTLIPILIMILANQFAHDSGEGNLFQMITIRTLNEEGNYQENHTISATASAIALVVTAVVLLSAIWLLIKQPANWIPIILFVFITAASTWRFLTLPYIHRHIAGLSSHKWVSIAVKAVLATIVAVSWLVVPTWITYDLVFFLIAFGALATIGPIRPINIVIVCLCMIGFDIWGVFMSGFIKDIAFESSFTPPVVLMIPDNPLNLGIEEVAGMGLGDVMFAGAIFLTANKHRYGGTAITGFAVAILATLLFSALIQSAVPALLTIVPIMFLFIGAHIGIRRLRRRFQK